MDLKRGKFHPNIEIVTPTTLTSDKLLEALAGCIDNAQMLEFINLLSRTPGVKIIADQQTVSMGNAAKFAHVFANVGHKSKTLNKEKQKTIIAHLQKSTFDKDQLTYLLRNLSTDSLRDLVLSSQNLSREDLSEICSDVTLLESLWNLTSKMLYHTLNPKRKWGASSTPYLEMYYIACRYGHVLGLTEDLRVTLKNRKVRFLTSGNCPQASLALLSGFLTSYQDRFYSECFKPIAEAIKVCEALHVRSSNEYTSNAAHDLFKRYEANQLTFIASGWPGHTVGVTLYGNYLSYRNRGEAGDPVFGCKIYKIKNPSLVKDLIIDLVKQQKNSTAFEAALAKVIDLKGPVIKLRSQRQKRGNCSFANPKSSIMDMLLLQEAGLNASKEDLVFALIQNKYRRTYKAFTTFMREEEIDELVKSMFFSSDPDLIQFYAAVVKAIVTEHHGKNRGYVKDKNEVKRAVDLFDRSTTAIQDILKADADFMKLMDKIRIEYQKLFGFNQNSQDKKPQTTLVWDYRRYCQREVTIEKGNIISIDGNPTPKMPFSYRMAKKLIPITVT